VLLSLLRRRRRRRLLATPFPPEWRRIVDAIPLCAVLDPADRRRHEDVLRVVATERRFEGCGGLVLEERMKVVVAAQAALLCLGIEHTWFSEVTSVLLYPTSMWSPWGRGDAGLGQGGRTPIDGQAWPHGPVILAWDRVEREAASTASGRNVVLHEFAHHLDAANGIVDGVPWLQRRVGIRRWASVLRPEFETLAAASAAGEATLLDEYGASDPAEFFAVAVECFFTRARELRERHRALYDVLSAWLGQDPAGRPAPV
jgi:Mlc titration factor MtfA (ptsG expression regulator)